MHIPYICGRDYGIPDMTLPEKTNPIGKWGRMRREYLTGQHPVRYLFDFFPLLQLCFSNFTTIDSHYIRSFVF